VNNVSEAATALSSWYHSQVINNWMGWRCVSY